MAAPEPTLMAAAPEPVAGARPDGLPDAYWDEATGSVKPEAYAKLAALEAATAGVPEAADKYVLELPEPIVGMDGKPVAFDAEDPLVKALLPAFHEAGVPQEGLSKILQAYAQTEMAALAAEQEAAKAHVEAEQAKLGAEHAKRTAALHSTLIATVGQEHAEALRSQMRDAAAVIALEKLVSSVAGPALSAAPPAKPHSDLDGLHGAELLAAARARKAG